MERELPFQSPEGVRMGERGTDGLALPPFLPFSAVIAPMGRKGGFKPGRRLFHQALPGGYVGNPIPVAWLTIDNILNPVDGGVVVGSFFWASHIEGGPVVSVKDRHLFPFHIKSLSGANLQTSLK